MSLTGGCLCRKIRYTIEGRPLGSGLCLCRDCQYASGGNGAAGFVVTRDSVAIQGEPRAYHSTTHLGGQATRYFCPDCGTPLFGEKSSAPQMMAIMAGTLDEPDIFKPEGISWTEAAPSWVKLDPGLPHFERDIG